MLNISCLNCNNFCYICQHRKCRDHFHVLSCYFVSGIDIIVCIINLQAIKFENWKNVWNLKLEEIFEKKI